MRGYSVRACQDGRVFLAGSMGIAEAHGSRVLLDGERAGMSHPQLVQGLGKLAAGILGF